MWFNYNLLSNKMAALGQPNGYQLATTIMGFSPATNGIGISQATLSTELSASNYVTLVDVANYMLTNKFDKLYIKSNSAPIVTLSTSIPAFNTAFTNSSGTRNFIEGNITCAAVLAGSSAAGIVVNGREEAQTSAGNILNTAPGMLSAYVATNDVWWITNHLAGVGSTATINTFTIKAMN